MCYMTRKKQKSRHWTRVVFCNMLVLLLCFVCFEGISGNCVNSDPDIVCDGLAANGYCLLNPAYTQCKCQKSCFAPPYCNAAGNLDKYCDCTSTAFYCDISPLTVSDCPTTCSYRAGPDCAAPVIQYVDISSPPPYKYGDVITMSCMSGTVNKGGSKGKRVCGVGGSWVYSLTEGTPPICELPTCGQPDMIPYAKPSQATAVSGDTVTYSCQDKAVQIGGGNGAIICGGPSWLVVAGQFPPICRATEVKFKKATNIQLTMASLDVKTARSSIECSLQCLYDYTCSGYTYTAGACQLNRDGVTSTTVLTTYVRNMPLQNEPISVS